MTRITTASSDADILGVLHETADAVFGVLNANTDWGLSGKRATQYSVDLRADAAALEVLHAAGIAVMSEESGRTGEWNDDSIIVVMDPLDGSTNASRRVPWYATALAAVDSSGHRASLVANQFTNENRWTATRGGGAFHNGERISFESWSRQWLARSRDRMSLSWVQPGCSVRESLPILRRLGRGCQQSCVITSGSMVRASRNTRWRTSLTIPRSRRRLLRSRRSMGS
ncbi:MAG: hypothetical protein EB138_04595 [Actinobacteria bacterium]|nr:hypothetical protein [Actinomycetota bacterium]